MTWNLAQVLYIIEEGMSMKNQCLLGLLLFSLCTVALSASAQDLSCPHFSGAAKKRVEELARWVVSDSLQKQVAERSIALGRLVAYLQCDVLKTRIISGEDMVLEGPFFAVAGVPLKSMLVRNHGIWMMAVAPSEAGGTMPYANLLEVTDKQWTLLHREDSGQTRVLATGTY